MFGKGHQTRDFTYIDDIVEIYEQAVKLEMTTNKSRITDIGTGKGTSILEIVKMMSEITKKEAITEFKPERPGEIGNFVADTTLLKSIFGTVPSTSVYDGLEKTIEWIKQN